MSQVIVVSPEQLHYLVASAVRDGVSQALKGITQTSTGNMPENEAARYLGVSPNTLRSWRCQKIGPVYHKSGRAVRYSKADLDIWQATNRILTVDSQEIQGRFDGMSR